MPEKQKWQPTGVARIRKGRIQKGEPAVKVGRVKKVQIVEPQPLIGGIEVLAGFWIVAGATLIVILADLFIRAARHGESRNGTLLIGAMLLAGLPAAVHLVISTGMLLRSKWSYYAAIGLSILWMVLFPIGTVLGYFGIKMLRGKKAAFGVR